MKYKVIHSFADLHDKKYKYETGDMFPRPGLEVSKDRIKELTGSKNKLGMPLLEEIPEETSKEIPKKEPEKKTTKRKSKNADRTVQRTE